MPLSSFPKNLHKLSLSYRPYNFKSCISYILVQVKEFGEVGEHPQEPIFDVPFYDVFRSEDMLKREKGQKRRT